MAVTNREIVELVAGSDARATAAWVRRDMERGGSVVTELDDWFVTIDESHTLMKIELDGNPDLRAEMPVDEFFKYLDEIATGSH